MSKVIAVYGGSYSSLDPKTGTQIDNAAAVLGEVLGAHGITVLTGGGRGLMQIVMDHCKAKGGDALGIVPIGTFQPNSICDEHPTQATDDLHTRLADYWRIADGHIALPGGIGTISEFMQAAMMARCGKPAPTLLMNVEGYYDPLIEMINKARRHGFLGDMYDRFILDSTPFWQDDDLKYVLGHWLVNRNFISGGE